MARSVVASKRDGWAMDFEPQMHMHMIADLSKENLKLDGVLGSNTLVK